MSEKQQSEIADLDAIISHKNDIRLLPVEDPRTGFEVGIASVPGNRKLQSLKPLLDEYLERPTRRIGTATLETEESFHLIVNRYMSEEHTVLFLNPDAKAPTVTAVFDHHTAGPLEKVGKPPMGQDAPVVTGFGQHRAVLRLRLSDEWKAWHAVNNAQLGQIEFAELLQDRIGDLVVVNPAENTGARDLIAQLDARLGTPQRIMSLARGLTVKANASVRAAITLESGEGEISYAESHTDANGAKLTVPTLFYIGIPVFYAGPTYLIPVRVRYRLSGGTLVWSIALHRADRVFDDALKQVRAAVTLSTGLQVLVGQPDA